MLLKIKLFCELGVMQCVYAYKIEVKKEHYFTHTVDYCCSSMPRLTETHKFSQS